MPYADSKTFRSGSKKPKCLLCGTRKNVIRDGWDFHCTYCGWDCPVDCEDHGDAGLFHDDF